MFINNKYINENQITKIDYDIDIKKIKHYDIYKVSDFKYILRKYYNYGGFCYLEFIAENGKFYKKNIDKLKEIKYTSYYDEIEKNIENNVYKLISDTIYDEYGTLTVLMELSSGSVEKIKLYNYSKKRTYDFNKEIITEIIDGEYFDKQSLNIEKIYDIIMNKKEKII